MHGSKRGKAREGLPISIFTAATCAISFNKTLSVNTPFLFFNGILYKKYSTSVAEQANLGKTESTALTL